MLTYLSAPGRETPTHRRNDGSDAPYRGELRTSAPAPHPRLSAANRKWLTTEQPPTAGRSARAHVGCLTPADRKRQSNKTVLSQRIVGCHVMTEQMFVPAQAGGGFQ